MVTPEQAHLELMKRWGEPSCPPLLVAQASSLCEMLVQVQVLHISNRAAQRLVNGYSTARVEGEPIPDIMPLLHLLTVVYLVRQASQLGRPRESRKWRM
jgi:hypothetical protein